MRESKFCNEQITPWLKEKRKKHGWWFRRVRGFHDYLICAGGRFMVIEAKDEANANRQPPQIRDEPQINKASGLWFTVWPENWDYIKHVIEEKTHTEECYQV